MRRTALAFAVLVLLGGCGGRTDERAPFTDSRIPPGLESRFYPPEGWAWGLLQVGDAPAVRYGVSAPSTAPRGQILILPDYGEPAEVWFETARDLNRRGLVVWVLEAAGQAGSGRYASPRDLGHSEGFAPDVAAVQVMAQRVARDRRLTVMASGRAAPVAVLALQERGIADRLVLQAPRLQPFPRTDFARRMRQVGLSGFATGPRWNREAADDLALGFAAEPKRGRLRPAWQHANPDLRMSGPSWGWRAAFGDAAREAEAARASLPVPLLISAPAGDAAEARRICRGVRECRVITHAGKPAQHLEGDALRNVWLSTLAAPPSG